MTLHKTFKQQIEEIWDSYKEKEPELPDHEPYCWPIKKTDRHKEGHREMKDWHTRMINRECGDE